MNNKGITLDSYLKSKKKDKEFRVSFEEASMHLKLAHLIGRLRTESGLTQAELAREAKVSQPMIARLERGDQERVPTLSTLNKVLAVLGKEVEIVIKEAS